VKDGIYPKEILEQFLTMGIDPQKEIELSHCARKEPGLHYYSGAHISYGSVVSGNQGFLNRIRKSLGVAQKYKYEEVN
jgi:hypothetical protein